MLRFSYFNMSPNEVNTGWRTALSSGLIYRAVQILFSEKRTKALILNEFVNPLGKRCRILDIGCGPGNLARFLPLHVNYTGFDISSRYIETANRMFSTRANTRFICASVEDMNNHPDVVDDSIDLAIVHGVFHHVSDEIAAKMISLAGKKLTPGGKAVILEPVWLKNQSRLRRWVMRKDRGKNIKQENDWSSFFETSSSSWGESSCTIEQNLTRFYDLIVCRLTKR